MTFAPDAPDGMVTVVLKVLEPAGVSANACGLVPPITLRSADTPMPLLGVEPGVTTTVNVTLSFGAGEEALVERTPDGLVTDCPPVHGEFRFCGLLGETTWKSAAL